MLKVTYFSSFAIGECEEIFNNIDDINKDYEFHSAYNPYYTILRINEIDTGAILFEQSNPFKSQYEKIEVSTLGSSIKTFVKG